MSNIVAHHLYIYICVCAFKHNVLYLWLCAAVSRALRGGVGDPCSVTLSTSRLFLSGRQRPWRVSIGESTRFRGGSAEKCHKVIIGFYNNNFSSLTLIYVAAFLTLHHSLGNRQREKKNHSK